MSCVKHSDSPERPRALFPSKSLIKIIDVVLLIVASILVYQSCDKLAVAFSKADLDGLKLALLVTSAYWLSYLLVNHTLYGLGDEWTYRLEEKLVLDWITPEQASEIIEHRKFGTKVSTYVEMRHSELTVLEKKVINAFLNIEAILSKNKSGIDLDEKNDSSDVQSVMKLLDADVATWKDAHVNFVVEIDTALAAHSLLPTTELAQLSISIKMSNGARQMRIARAIATLDRLKELGFADAT